MSAGSDSCRNALALLAVACLCGFGMQDVPFEVLKRRPPRRSAEARYEVERSGEAVIVTIHAGRKPTGGYLVEVRKVTRDGGRCMIHYAVVPPPADAMVPQVITYPAVSVRLPSSCREVGVEPPLPRAPARSAEEERGGANFAGWDTPSVSSHFNR